MTTGIDRRFAETRDHAQPELGPGDPAAALTAPGPSPRRSDAAHRRAPVHEGGA